MRYQNQEDEYLKCGKGVDLHMICHEVSYADDKNNSQQNPQGWQQLVFAQRFFEDLRCEEQFVHHSGHQTLSVLVNQFLQQNKV